MKESTTYQEIIQEGRTDEAKSFVLKLGTKQLGRPTVVVTARLEEITDLGVLEKLTNHLIAGSPKTWAELLRRIG